MTGYKLEKVIREQSNWKIMHCQVSKYSHNMLNNKGGHVKLEYTIQVQVGVFSLRWCGRLNWYILESF